ncbi:MAG: hypothetical protein RR449_01980 [Christensenella sp.]
MTGQEKFSRLVEYIRQYDDVAVAFSGGTKSALMVCAAAEANDSRVWVLTANTPFFTQEELYRVHEVLDEYKVHNERVAMPELLDMPEIIGGGERCKVCAAVVSRRLADTAEGVGARVLLDGKTADEAQDVCCLVTSMSAEVRAVSPLAELQYTAQDAEEMLRAIGRGYYIKPTNACLARRFARGDVITAAKLDFIEAAEKYIRRFTRGDMAVCVDKSRVLVRSKAVFSNEIRSEVTDELMRNADGLNFTKIEFFDM